MSNRERIARAAEEARIAAAEKAAKGTKSAAKKTSGSASSRSSKNVRMKVIWEVCDGSGKAVKAFPYAEKAAAEADLEARTQSTGRRHVLRPTKVPMD